MFNKILLAFKLVFGITYAVLIWGTLFLALFFLPYFVIRLFKG